MNSGLSLADHITLELRADIIGGRLLPGMALVENDLVSAYNASRNTIREALHRLGQEGLTRYVRNKGVMVRKLGAADVRDLFNVRRTLELQAISASQPLRDYQSDRMLEALEATELAREREDWRAVGTHSLAFHNISSDCCAVRCSMNSSPMSSRNCAWCFAPRPMNRGSRRPGWRATGRSMSCLPKATSALPEMP